MSEILYLRQAPNLPNTGSAHEFSEKILYKGILWTSKISTVYKLLQKLNEHPFPPDVYVLTYRRKMFANIYA